MNTLRFQQKDETAVNGEWVKGPGMDFFEAMKKELGEKKVYRRELRILNRQRA